MLSFKYVYGCTWRDVTNGFGNADFAVRGVNDTHCDSGVA